MKKSSRRREEVIFLKDLVPRKDVKGGGGKRVFGQSVERTGRFAPTGPAKPEKKRSPKI